MRAAFHLLYNPFVYLEPTQRRHTLNSYVKCAEMMLEMKQTHDACSNFLEAAVRFLISHAVQYLSDAL